MEERKVPKECKDCKCRIYCEKQFLKLEIIKLLVTPKMLITIAFVILTIFQMMKGL